VAVGGQYRLSEKLTLRGGYLYNTNPIPDPVTLFNVQLPAIITNTLSLGASYALTEDITFSTAWVHGFRNQIEGGVAELPGASTKIDSQTDSIIAGLNIQFGGKRRRGSAAMSGESGPGINAAQ
jgi:long-chain fatty acid transport protein